MAIKLRINLIIQRSTSSAIEMDYFRNALSGINHKAEVNLIGRAELIELVFYVRAIKLWC